MFRIGVATCCIAVAVSACGATSSETTVVPAQTTTSTVISSSSTTLMPSSTTTTSDAVSPTTSAPAATTTTLAGQPTDLWVPQPFEGPIVGVVSVRYDDELNVRSGPSTAFPIVATLDPLAEGLSGTGKGWELPSGAVWWEIRVEEGIGWANQGYLSRFGAVVDLTAQVVDALGEIPWAPTMDELGSTVAATFVASDGEVEQVVTVVAAATVGDLGEITIDVVGSADDSVEGHRLHVFGQPADGGGFSLMAVESTILCLRGVSEGVCV